MHWLTLKPTHLLMPIQTLRCLLKLRHSLMLKLMHSLMPI
ncbi:hypothetical protein ERS044165_01920, partial [Streptococcus pneumoniae]